MRNFTFFVSFFLNIKSYPVYMLHNSDSLIWQISYQKITKNFNGYNATFYAEIILRIKQIRK